MRIAVFAAGLALATVSSAMAEEAKCNQPQASWKPVEQLTARLTSDGWDIKNVKTDEGCYEVYAKDKDGKKVEVYFDPVTFEQVGEDD